uniref:Uncharacterized protein n=1 Tax=Arundo donax TaxID=35708 RepID=A0A0A9CW92_ARUDO
MPEDSAIHIPEGVKTSIMKIFAPSHQDIVINQLSTLASNLCTQIDQSTMESQMPIIHSYINNVLHVICSGLAQGSSHLFTISSNCTYTEDTDSDLDETDFPLEYHVKIHGRKESMKKHSCSTSKCVQSSSESLEYFLKYFELFGIPNLESNVNLHDTISHFYTILESELISLLDGLNDEFKKPASSVEDLFPLMDTNNTVEEDKDEENSIDLLTLIEATVDTNFPNFDILGDLFGDEPLNQEKTLPDILVINLKRVSTSMFSL